MPVLTFESDIEYECSLRVAAQQGFVEQHPIAVALGAPPVSAYVNHGRWMVDCPICGAARNVTPGRHFWCAACGNQRYAGAALVITWPDDIDAIGELLAVRPRENQNYDPVEHRRHPYEPCPDGLVWLAFDNLLHGYPVPNDLVRARTEAWILADWVRRGLAEEMSGFAPRET